MDLLPTKRSLPRQNGIFKCGDGWAVLDDRDKPHEERRIFNIIINPSFIVRVLDKLKMEKRSMQFMTVYDISAYFKISISNANKARYEPIQVENSIYIRVEKYPRYTFIYSNDSANTIDADSVNELERATGLPRVAITRIINYQKDYAKLDSDFN
jgi:hypothetical protein